MKLPESFDRAMRDLRRAQIPVYAGNTAFFLVLSFLPLLTLLLAVSLFLFRREIATLWRTVKEIFTVRRSKATGGNA